MDFITRHLWWIAILVALGFFVVSGINTIPRLDEKVNASWAQVQNQYQRRMDLVPNLVATVKGGTLLESLYRGPIMTAWQPSPKCYPCARKTEYLPCPAFALHAGRRYGMNGSSYACRF